MVGKEEAEEPPGLAQLGTLAWALLAASLKHKLVASTAELRRMKDRVQQLQNELIRVGTATGEEVEEQPEQPSTSLAQAGVWRASLRGSLCALPLVPQGLRLSAKVLGGFCPSSPPRGTTGRRSW